MFGFLLLDERDDWVSKALCVTAEGGSLWPVYLAVGVLVTLAVVGWFVRRFRAVAYL